MKDFNLDLAKKGEQICTKSGKKARIICFNRGKDNSKYPIVALIKDDSGNELITCHTLLGEAQYDEDDSLYLDTEIEIVYPNSWEAYTTIIFSTKGKEQRDIIEDFIMMISYDDPILSKFYQVILLRDYYRQGWKPNLSDPGYSIRYDWNKFVRADSAVIPYLLSFPTKELRDLFFTNFLHLIEEAKEYIR